MIKQSLSFGVAAAIACLASQAFGQDPATPTSTPAAASPDIPSFVTMDRGDANSRVELATSFTSFDGDDDDIGFNTRLDLYGQYMGESGMAISLALPVSFLDDGFDINSAVGNIELGGLYVVKNPNGPVAIRASVARPTATGGFSEFLANFATSTGRLTDRSTSTIAETTWLRLSSSPMYRTGNAFFRLDSGIDVALDSPEFTEADPVFRLNLGAGITAGCMTFTSELVTVATVGEVDEGEDRFLHTFALSVRRHLSSIQGYAAFVVPMEANFDNGVSADYAITLGAYIPIGQ